MNTSMETLALLELYVPEYIRTIKYVPWVFSLLGSALIGLSGILPLIIIPSGETGKDKEIKNPADSKFLKTLLSFAVGGLLGDVFLHLLPEAWEYDMKDRNSNEHPSIRSGMWVLSGVLLFTIVEKIFSGYVSADENNPQPKCVEIANCLLRKNGGILPDGKTAVSCAPNGSCDIEDVPNGCFLSEKKQEGS